MSNEISYQFQTVLRNGSLQDQYASGQLSSNQTTALLVRNVANITTAVGGQALALGDVVTPGFAVFSNLEPVSSPPELTHYIEIGIYTGGTFYPFLKLLPGEQQCVKLGAIPYARANTVTTDLFYIIYSA